MGNLVKSDFDKARLSVGLVPGKIENDDRFFLPFQFIIDNRLLFVLALEKYDKKFENKVNIGQ